MSNTEFETTQAEESHVIERPAGTLQLALLFLVAAVVIVVDHLTKLIVENTLPLNQSWAPLPEFATFFRFTHVSNTGAAFGLFPGGSMIFTLIAIIVAAIIIIYNFRLPAGHLWLRLALGLQLGGALGNLIDRLRLGHVTDFLDFGSWPVFNLADTAIVTGVVILGVLMLKEQRHEQQMAQSNLAVETEENDSQPPISTSLQSSKKNEPAT